MNDKAILRRTFRTARKRIQGKQRQQAERTVCVYLKKYVKRGKKIALYWAMGSELNVLSLVQTAKQRQATIYLPYIEPKHKRLWFTPYCPNIQAERPRLTKWAIPQFSGKKIRANHLHTMVLPLLAADYQGYRLGQGGGFYDATLAKCRRRQPHKIGVGFACQLTNKLPHEPHDMRLDTFISEHGEWHFQQ